MRVLLSGSTGRLGGAFLSLWSRDGSGHEVRALRRENLDLSQPDHIHRALELLWDEGEFDVIVNPAAVSGIEQCLDQPELAQAVNVDAPRVMAEFCQSKGIQMVHFSTDYVFDGESEGQKKEADPVGAVNVYGETKQAGEDAVLASCFDALVCRVSWLFGPIGEAKPSHFDHVLDRTLSGEVQSLIGDKYSMPTFTHDIVDWVDVLLRHKCAGVYHLCNAGEPESWMSYAQKVCDLAQRHGHDVGRRNLQETSIKQADFFRDKRPVHTAMLPARLIEEGLAEPRHWLEAAEEYLKMR